MDKASHDLGASPELAILLARRQLRQGELEKAEATLLPLTTSHDDNARAAWSWIAATRLTGGDLPGALQAAEKTFDLDRNDPVATYVVAMALHATRDQRALAWLERAHLLSPNNGVLWAELEKARAEVKAR